jgi:hypothetical protein
MAGSSPATEWEECRQPIGHLADVRAAQLLQGILYSAPIVRRSLVATLLVLADHLRCFGQRFGTMGYIKLVRMSLNFDRVHLRASLKISQVQLM